VAVVVHRHHQPSTVSDHADSGVAGVPACGIVQCLDNQEVGGGLDPFRVSPLDRGVDLDRERSRSARVTRAADRPASARIAG
jgi:hypothetical protein